MWPFCDAQFGGKHAQHDLTCLNIHYSMQPAHDSNNIMLTRSQTTRGLHCVLSISIELLGSICMLACWTVIKIQSNKDYFCSRDAKFDARMQCFCIYCIFFSKSKLVVCSNHIKLNDSLNFGANGQNKTEISQNVIKQKINNMSEFSSGCTVATSHTLGDCFLNHRHGSKLD